MTRITRHANFKLLLLIPSLCACTPSEQEIQAEFVAFVGERNQCDVASDCELARAECPLGCFVYVNRAKVAEVEAKATELVDEYSSAGATCAYDCVEPPGATCEAQRCISK
jgi:hypothetical protein